MLRMMRYVVSKRNFFYRSFARKHRSHHQNDKQKDTKPKKIDKKDIEEKKYIDVTLWINTRYPFFHFTYTDVNNNNENKKV